MIHRQSNWNGGDRAGFTLLEMLVVMAALSVCLLMGATLLVTTIKAERVAETAADRVSRRQALAGQFREDVAQAQAAPDKWGDAVASPALLILEMPGGSAVLYQWQDNALERIERKGENKSRRAVPVGPPGTDVEFIRSAAGLGMVTIRITEPSRSGPAKTAELAAALGGKLR